MNDFLKHNDTPHHDMTDKFNNSLFYGSFDVDPCQNQRNFGYSVRLVTEVKFFSVS